MADSSKVKSGEKLNLMDHLLFGLVEGSQLLDSAVVGATDKFSAEKVMMEVLRMVNNSEHLFPNRAILLLNLDQCPTAVQGDVLHSMLDLRQSTADG